MSFLGVTHNLMLIPHPVQHQSIVLFVFIGWEEEELKGHNTSRTTHSQQSTKQPRNACVRARCRKDGPQIHF